MQLVNDVIHLSIHLFMKKAITKNIACAWLGAHDMAMHKEQQPGTQIEWMHGQTGSGHKEQPDHYPSDISNTLAFMR